jgi:UDP-galactopyranose mutase
MYDVLLVGAGLFSAVFARQCLDAGRKVLVIERRAHPGGNCYTERRNGIDVHVYGPHIFHTSSARIWDYVRQFANFNNFVNRPKVHYNGRLYSFPINLFTLYQLWGVQTPEEARRKLDEVRVPIENPANLEEWVLSQVGEEIYGVFIRGYTQKQWMRDPRQLPASIIRRLPIRLTFDDNYFNDTFQGIPEDGYTALLQRLLDGATIELEQDYFAAREAWDARARTVVFTGRLDQFYDHRFGPLEYRTLRFEHEQHAVEDYQGNAIVNYTAADVPYTRVVEHKHFSGARSPLTHITREYPVAWEPQSVPYYPISDAANTAKYEQYAALVKLERKHLFGGRLAEYRYYDMHQVIGSALTAAAKYLENRP